MKINHGECLHADALAKNFDTTPRRTKEVVLPRMRDEYDIHQAPVWDSPEKEREYEEWRKLAEDTYDRQEILERKLKTLKRITGSDNKAYMRSIAFACTCRCPMHEIGSNQFMWQIIEQGETPEITEAIHMLFNPHNDYYTMHFRDGKPGKRLTRGFVRREHRSRGFLPGEREKKYNVASEGYYLLPEAAENSWIVRSLRFHDQEWSREMADKIVAMLRPIYEQTIFWMVPYDPFPRRLMTDSVPPVGGERRFDQWPQDSHWDIEPMWKPARWL